MIEKQENSSVDNYCNKNLIKGIFPFLAFVVVQPLLLSNNNKKRNAVQQDATNIFPVNENFVEWDATKIYFQSMAPGLYKM